MAMFLVTPATKQKGMSLNSTWNSIVWLNFIYISQESRYTHIYTGIKRSKCRYYVSQQKNELDLKSVSIAKGVRVKLFRRSRRKSE